MLQGFRERALCRSNNAACVRRNMKMKCVCSHKGQDELNGSGIRVFNPRVKKERQPQMWRCSVCSSEKEAPGAIAVVKKEVKK